MIQRLHRTHTIPHRTNTHTLYIDQFPVLFHTYSVSSNQYLNIVFIFYFKSALFLSVSQQTLFLFIKIFISDSYYSFMTLFFTFSHSHLLSLPFSPSPSITFSNSPKLLLILHVRSIRSNCTKGHSGRDCKLHSKQPAASITLCRCKYTLHIPTVLFPILSWSQ